VRIAAPTNLLRIELTIFFLSLIMIALQAMHPSWRHHTLVDGYFAYYDKVSYFLKNNTLQGIPFNEYQPGAIFYFLSVAPILAIKDSRETYLNGLILSNLLLCMGYGWIILKQKNPGGLALFSAMLMLGGPLILFRFELYSHLLVLAGLLLWQKKREYWGAFMLGVSTTVKVYPLLLVPLLLKNAVVHKEFAKAIQICISYAAGIVAALLLYMVVFHVSAQEVLKNVLVHSHKPLHIESISGSILRSFTGVSLRMDYPGITFLCVVVSTEKYWVVLIVRQRWCAKYFLGICQSARPTISILVFTLHSIGKTKDGK
jgi:hypothetical protein